MNFNAVTGSDGVVWAAAEPLTFAITGGRGWRAPVAAELFFKGSDEGAMRYKIDDNTLTPEASLNVDVSACYSSTMFSAEISVFRNMIDHYIFLVPTGQKVNGLDSFSGC